MVLQFVKCSFPIRRIVRELDSYRVDPYYLLTFNFLVDTHSDSTTLKELCM